MTAAIIQEILSLIIPLLKHKCLYITGTVKGKKEIDAQMCFLREKLINLSGKKCQESL